MNVPVVYLDTVGQDFTTTTLLGDNRRRATLHGLQRRDTKRLAHRRHDIDIRIFQALIHLLSTHESREVETVGNATLCSEINHLIHHIAGTSHTETHIASTMQHHIGSLDKVFRTFLHSNTSQEGYHLLLALMVGTRNVLPLLLQWINSIVHGKTLAWVLMILIDDCLTGKL